MEDFSFKPVDESFISKQIDKLSVKKANGYDGISAKLLKLAKPSIVAPVTELVSSTIQTSKFPDPLETGQVAPISYFLSWRLMFFRKCIKINQKLS